LGLFAPAEIDQIARANHDALADCIWCQSLTIPGCLPTKLSGDEYPNLLAPDETIDTIATSVLLASFTWPDDSERYRRMAKFVDAFVSKFDEFHKPPRHLKWAEASINIKIPRWERFKAADDWTPSAYLNGNRSIRIKRAALYRQYSGGEGPSRSSR